MVESLWLLDDGGATDGDPDFGIGRSRSPARRGGIVR